MSEPNHNIAAGEPAHGPADHHVAAGAPPAATAIDDSDWVRLHAEDFAAGKAVVMLMLGIFLTGVFIYSVVAYWVVSFS
jgi:hypothetical protein